MLEEVRSILSEALQLGERAQCLVPDTPLLGSIAEFDSMTVVTVLTLLEERLGLEIEDDDISAEIFETVGSLVDFVESKCSA
jgi:acyl carrier protein